SCAVPIAPPHFGHVLMSLSRSTHARPPHSSQRCARWPSRSTTNAHVAPRCLTCPFISRSFSECTRPGIDDADAPPSAREAVDPADLPAPALRHGSALLVEVGFFAGSVRGGSQVAGWAECLDLPGELGEELGDLVEAIAVFDFDLAQPTLAPRAEVLVPVSRRVLGTEDRGEHLVGGLGVVDLDLGEPSVDGVELVLGAEHGAPQFGHRPPGVAEQDALLV